MKSRKKLLVGVLVAIISGTIYYFAFRKGKADTGSVGNGDSVQDSVASSSDKVAPLNLGSKPERNPSSGSIKIVEDFVKSNAKNPSTFEFLEWSELSVEDGYWKVRCKYRGISSFNAEVTTNAWFYIKNNKVVYTKVISKI